MKIRLLVVSILALLLLFSGSCQRTVRTPLPEPSPTAAPLKSVIAPFINIYANTEGLSSKGLTLNIEARIDNPNPFIVNIGNLRFTVRSETGQIYDQEASAGGSITPKLSESFLHKPTIAFSALNEKKLVIVVEAEAKAENAITVPVSATETFYVPDAQKLIKSPTKTLDVKIEGLSKEGLKTTVLLKVNNPNQFSLSTGDMRIEVKDQAGKYLATSTIMAGSIAPNSDGNFTGIVMLPIEALNEKIIVVSTSAMAAVGSITTLSLNASANVTVPRLGTLIPNPEMKVNIEHYWIGEFPKVMLQILINSTITNSSDINLNLYDFNSTIYRADGSLLKSVSMLEATVNLRETKTFTNPILVGQAFSSGLIAGTTGESRSEIADILNTKVTIKVKAQIGIQGINQRLPLSGESILPIKLMDVVPTPR